MFIPLSECVVRGIYKVHSRNLLVAVYCGERAFIGLREKFNYIYLDTEWANAQDERRGAWAKEFLGILPDGIELWTSRKDANGEWETNSTLLDYLVAQEKVLYPG